MLEYEVKLHDLSRYIQLAVNGLCKNIFPINEENDPELSISTYTLQELCNKLSVLIPYEDPYADYYFREQRMDWTENTSGYNIINQHVSLDTVLEEYYDAIVNAELDEQFSTIGDYLSYISHAVRYILRTLVSNNYDMYNLGSVFPSLSFDYETGGSIRSVFFDRNTCINYIDKESLSLDDMILCFAAISEWSSVAWNKIYYDNISINDHVIMIDNEISLSDINQMYDEGTRIYQCRPFKGSFSLSISDELMAEYDGNTYMGRTSFEVNTSSGVWIMPKSGSSSYPEHSVTFSAEALQMLEDTSEPDAHYTYYYYDSTDTYHRITTDQDFYDDVYQLCISYSHPYYPTDYLTVTYTDGYTEDAYSITADPNSSIITIDVTDGIYIIGVSGSVNPDY